MIAVEMTQLEVEAFRSLYALKALYYELQIRREMDPRGTIAFAYAQDAITEARAHVYEILGIDPLTGIWEVKKEKAV